MGYIFLTVVIFLIAYLYIVKNKSYRNIYQSVNDALLSYDELMNHARELAKYHTISKQKKGYNYLFNRLKYNYSVISEVYKSLNKYGKMDLPLCPASEWLLDNFYIIEEQYKELQKNVDNRFYKKLYILNDGQFKNFPRIFAVALEIVSHTDGRIDKDHLVEFINSYQSQNTLSMSELWALAPMIKIALIEKIAHVCENIKLSQEQWNKAQNIKGKTKSEIIKEIQTELSGSSEAKFSYIEHLLKILKKMETNDEEIIKVIDEYLLKFDTELEKVINHEHQEQASFQVTIGNCITSIRLVIAINWEEIFDKLSIVEKILSSDPSQVYSCMDNDSRTYYRKQVEKIAAEANVTETMVARKAVNCAASSNIAEKTVHNHIGYYLIGKGKPELYKELSTKKYSIENRRKNFALYILSFILLSFLIVNFIVFYSYNSSKSILLAALSIILTLIPASELSITIINWVITHTYDPSFLPKLEFRDGIDDDKSTLVVVPTIFPDIERVKRLFEKLEVTYLSNHEKNIYFALLGDLKDANEQELPEDKAIIDFAMNTASSLNRKYCSENDSFYLFIRNRTYSSSQSKWIGWERKRGAIVALNDFLVNSTNDNFPYISGNMDKLKNIKYVITLDADTVLTIDTAKKLIGTISHPLNSPVIDRKKGIVTEGYGLIQPRIGIDIQSSNKSIFSKIFAGVGGIDTYTTAISDVYQDLFKEGIFTGKGIYDLHVFTEILNNTIPENTVLSHDLLEGSYIRVGLSTDIELIDGFPEKYNSYMMRLQRWIRGDWQLIMWLNRYIRNKDCKIIRNPLGIVSKWKIFDNLRRSIVPSSIIILIFSAVLFLPGNVLFWIGLAFLTAFFPVLTSMLDYIYLRYYSISKQKLNNSIIYGVKAVFFQTFLLFIFLPYQSFVQAKSILKTLFRLFISKKNLLEWVTAADAEKTSRNTSGSYLRSMSPSLIKVIILPAAVVLLNKDHIFASVVLTVLWLSGPYTAYRISIPAAEKTYEIKMEDLLFLRRICIKTWGFYRTFADRDNNYLPVDNHQIKPIEKTAHRTSPTNIGFLLMAILSARDLGYISIHSLLERINNTLDTISKLEKWNGHLYNWYDTKTLEVLNPRYISTVDSGNLVGYFITLKRGLLNSIKDPILSMKNIQGIFDAALLKKEQCPNILTTLESYIENGKFDICTCIEILKKLTSYSDELSSSEILSDIVNSYNMEIEAYYPDQLINPEAAHKIRQGLTDDICKIINSFSSCNSLATLYDLYEMIQCEINSCKNNSKNENLYKLEKEVAAKRGYLANKIEEIYSLVDQLDFFIKNTSFTPLYDEKVGLFSIGYNVQDNKLTNSYYDLLASEARITSYLAVSRREVPVSHWFKLGRSLVDIDGYLSLVSWTGTMFEYLMPPIIMKNFKNTLFDETYLTVVKAQIKYGRMRKLLWGTSESGFYTFDLHLNYQYKAFGVPDLGLKRGLINDMVVSPYSSVLALTYCPEEALSNLMKLAKCNVEGNYGLFEAVDFTPGRVPYNKSYSIVESFMAHHQGMILTSINNFINKGIMVDRFHSEPVIKSGEFLLQEKIPLRVIITKENKEEVEPFINLKQKDISVVRELSEINTPLPACHILSNGSFSTIIDQRGSGYIKHENIQITRWREDKLSESPGYYIFLKDVSTDSIFSAAFEPVCSSPESYRVKFSQDKADFIRIDNEIETRTEICVSPEDNCEIRRLTITNHRDIPLIVECTSYFEVVLNNHMADIAHPSFSNLFIRTDYLKDYNCLLAWRRPRNSSDDTFWLFHSLICNGEVNGDMEYETSRYKFIGRNKSIQMACSLSLPLSCTTGAVLDPVMSLRRKVVIPPGKSSVLSFATGFSQDKQKITEMIHKYNEYSSNDRAFDLSHIRSQMAVKYLNLNAEDLKCFDEMLSHLIYQSPLRKKYQEYICKNKFGQSGLWPFGISGDLPIILATINKIDDIDTVKALVKAHEYYRSKGFRTDLVILNQDESNYLQPLQNAIRDTILSSHARDMFNSPGGIYLLNSNLITEEERILLFTSSRIVLNSNHHIKPQLKIGNSAKNSENKIILKNKDNPPALIPEEDYQLDFFNGYGGFNTQKKEYVIKLRENLNTPAPWSNIISNENFGFLITESGSGYVWSENSRENKLTPWSNDPVIDSPGETIYIRDDESGYFWSITPMPIREKEVYTIIHGLGYTIFRHNSNGIAQELTEFVPLNDSVKLSLVKLKNYTKENKKLSVYYYAKPVLGVSEYITGPYIHTEYNDDTGSLIARNCFSSDFPGRIMHVSSSLATQYYTGNRTEFLGNCTGLCSPEALFVDNLSNTTGSGLDSCCVIKCEILLSPERELEFSLMLGQEKSLSDMINTITKYKSIDYCKLELEKVREFWYLKNNIVQVETPDNSMNTLVNNFLLYQVISCRLWARSAFYQSGGAYGFRDQLQDVLSLIYAFPELARKQIILHAGHQFIEGDVLHWWHPGDIEKGIRTKFSDDLLWLPFVTSEYINKTGDYSILDEQCSFVEGITLNNDEDEKYGAYSMTDTSASVYDHCILAVEKSLKFGPHGIPLMGSGDWNDGMNTVGNKGSGESIWLGWFICSTLKNIIPLCKTRNDLEKADKYEHLIENITNSIDENAWDGNWYRRAYFDDGTPLGSINNHECKIDSIAQSWAVISNAPNTERMKKSMQSVENYLVKHDEGLIMLFTPPFDNGDLKPGYIKGYVPGVRENGGQYTHAAVWTISAFAKLHNGNIAADLFNLINPVNHTMTQIQCSKYKVEPYVLAADVYSVDPHNGRGGWTWYTGSASWMYKACIEDILGFTKNRDTLTINPCLPDNWKSSKIKYRYQDTFYDIEIINERLTTTGASTVYFDDELNPDNEIKLINDKRNHHVKIILT